MIGAPQSYTCTTCGWTPAVPVCDRCIEMSFKHPEVYAWVLGVVERLKPPVPAPAPPSTAASVGCTIHPDGRVTRDSDGATGHIVYDTVTEKWVFAPEAPSLPPCEGCDRHPADCICPGRPRPTRAKRKR